MVSNLLLYLHYMQVQLFIPIFYKSMDWLPQLQFAVNSQSLQGNTKMRTASECAREMSRGDIQVECLVGQERTLKSIREQMHSWKLILPSAKSTRFLIRLSVGGRAWICITWMSEVYLSMWDCRSKTFLTKQDRALLGDARIYSTAMNCKIFCLISSAVQFSNGNRVMKLLTC